ncbi:unnamed protein product [Cercopithifilaria johnstoni]|uniref:Uncharacterized protein n=1 Tax=Cercopithifilaria johnstoni TaxID=2874296 RepID=A0A8J2Q5H5_9BILA|nr:unnamed protein product [Cercopithifilaria johnstoni]
MAFLRTSPLTSPSTCCMEYAHIVSMKELVSSLAMLSNSNQSAAKAQRRQTIVSCMSGMANLPTLNTATTLDALNQSGVLITSLTTPDIAQGNAVHRGSASSISSISSGNIQPLSSLLYASQQFSSSTSSSLGFGEMFDNQNPEISTSVFLDLVEIMKAATSASTTGQNVVPIDNKIEQAMDLVKTHLTFAVREEVEILRSTIVELEAKVAQLESQNQVLKQFAPVEVVNSLAVLVQQQQQRQMQLQQQQLSSGATSPNPAQPISVQSTQVPVQGIQKQSMKSEVSVSPTSLPSIVPPVGLPPEVQPSAEQKQPKQLSVTGIVDSNMQ